MAALSRLKMIDPGTALGIAGLAYDVTKDLYDYYRAWKHCDTDVKELRVQLLWLSDAFKVCVDVVGRPGLSADGTRLLCQALASCEDATKSLRAVLIKIKEEWSPQSVLEKTQSIDTAGLLPIQEEDCGRDCRRGGILSRRAPPSSESAAS